MLVILAVDDEKDTVTDEGQDIIEVEDEEEVEERLEDQVYIQDAGTQEEEEVVVSLILLD